MFLAVNQSLHNSKKRREAATEKATITTSATTTATATATRDRKSRETTDSTTQLVANMLMNAPSPSTETETETGAEAEAEAEAAAYAISVAATSPMGNKCDRCQHMQQSEKSHRQSVATSEPCNCACNCINKLEASANVRTSLVLVYIYLGAHSLMLATLAILFYTYTQSGEEPPTPAMLGQRAFHAQFQGELLRSEHVLRAMVAQIMERDYPLDVG